MEGREKFLPAHFTEKKIISIASILFKTVNTNVYIFSKTRLG